MMLQRPKRMPQVQASHPEAHQLRQMPVARQKVSGARAVVPIAVVLFEKGIPLGTALAFMMAISALSLPEAIMLRRVMRLSLIAVFFGITTAGIMLSGFLMNLAAGAF